jgi:hypothetical protein
MIKKISPDKERAKSLFKMAVESEKSRKKIFSIFANDEDQTMLAQNYYEAIRQLILSLMLFDGFKTWGENAHRETINYLKKYKEFTTQEIAVLQDLRMRRNRGMYEGKFIRKPYLENNKEKLEMIIKKLKGISEGRLG